MMVRNGASQGVWGTPGIVPLAPAHNAAMTRPSQLLHPPRPPVPTLNAATVLLLRDGAQGLEVLMTRRSMKASFAPGAYVFPGGGIDALDAQSHAAAARRATQSDEQLTQAIAAIRESFEELGVLLARHLDGRWADADDIAALDRHAPFAAQCQARGLQLAAESPTATCPSASTCPFSWRACPRARRPWPTRPSSSSPSGCARRRRWSATRLAASS
jgi:8-oxo-dGTP pyrophosphatase MutT (NUDIX family)